MAFKWYTANDGSARGEDEESAVEFVIEAPRKRGGKTTGSFFGYASPTLRYFVPPQDFHGTVSGMKKRADKELAKAHKAESIAPPRKVSRSSGTAKVAFWGGLAALGGLAAWGWSKSK